MRYLNPRFTYLFTYTLKSFFIIIIIIIIETRSFIVLRAQPPPGTNELTNKLTNKQNNDVLYRDINLQIKLIHILRFHRRLQTFF